MRHAGPTFALLLSLVAGIAFADDQPSGADASAIRDVISHQLEAFRSGDGATAESFAAPGIKQKFASPEMFMGMVQGSYGALIKPRSTSFGELGPTSLGLVQKLTIIDSSGVLWTAAYTMVLVDGQWRISGCFLQKADAVNA